MKLFTKIASFAIVALMLYSSVFAQQVELLEGTDFMFGIPHCHTTTGEASRGVPIQLWVSSKTKCRVTVEGGGNVTTVNLDPKKVKVVQLSDGLMNTRSEVIQPNGIKVTATAPITATVYISYKWSGEAYRVLPNEVLGRKYYTLNMYQDKIGNGDDMYRAAEILVTAVEDNTVVTYKPACETELGVKKGASKTVALRAGDCYLIKAKIKPENNQDNSSDLTGTAISSNKPISCISGHSKGAFPRYSATMLGTNTSFMRNMLMDCMWPVEFLGKEYVSAPIMYADRPRYAFDQDSWGDLIRMLAVEDGTIIYKKSVSDTSWQRISKILKAGEFHELTNMEDAAAYRSNKPFMVGQYGKSWRNANVNPIMNGSEDEVNISKKDKVELQNPPRNGQGMMFVLTPKEKWATYTTFYSPEAIDNFVMITFYNEDLNKLTFDGVPFRSIFGASSVKTVPGTDMAYIVKGISAGNHTIEGAKFTAYVYGNWDRSKDGFAYGYPTGVNFTQACEDSISIESSIECGFVSGKTKTTPDTSSCARLIKVYPIEDSTYNFKDFNLEKFYVSDRWNKSDFTYQVSDLSKPAHAVIASVTQSGKIATTVVHYEPEKIESDPTSLVFEKSIVGSTDSNWLKLSNVGKGNLTIKELKLKKNLEEFSLVSEKPLPVTLAPKEFLNVKVIAKTTKSGIFVDSVIAVLSCYEKSVAEVKIESGRPCFTMEDAAFPPSPIGVETSKEVRIENTTQFDLNITGIWYPGKGKKYPEEVAFREDLSNKLPITLRNKESITFKVYYTALSENQKDKFYCVLESNADPLCSDSSEWSGSGKDAKGLLLGVDWLKRRVLDPFNRIVNNVQSYDSVVIVKNLSGTNEPLKVVSVEVNPNTFVGPSGESVNTSFKFLTNEIPDQIFPGVYTTPVEYSPNAEGVFKTGIRFIYDYNNKKDTSFAELKGIAVQPHFEGTGYTFQDTLFISKQDKNGKATTSNATGSMDLTVFDVQLVGDIENAFEIDAAYLNTLKQTGKIMIPMGSLKNIPVWFTAKRIGSHKAQIRIVHDGKQADSIVNGYSVSYLPLEGFGKESGAVEPMHYDFGTHYISKSIPDNLHVGLKNLGSLPIEVTNVEPIGNTARYFGYNKIPTKEIVKADPNSPMLLDIFFRAEAPVRYGNEEFGFIYTYKQGSEEFTATSYVYGTGKKDSSLIYIDKNYRFGADDFGIAKAIDIKSTPLSEKIDKGEISNFKVGICYNPKFIRFEEDPTKLMESRKANFDLSGSMCENWEIINVNIFKSESTEFDTVIVEVDSKSSTILLEQRNQTDKLFSVKLTPYYSSTLTSSLPCYFVHTSPWFEVLNEPGEITWDPFCVSGLRHINISGFEFQLKSVSPNPTNSKSVTVDYSVGYETDVKFSLVNSLGVIVREFVIEKVKPGSHDFKIDPNDLVGPVFLKMQAGHWTSPPTLIVGQ